MLFLTLFQRKIKKLLSLKWHANIICTMAYIIIYTQLCTCTTYINTWLYIGIYFLNLETCICFNHIFNKELLHRLIMWLRSMHRQLRRIQLRQSSCHRQFSAGAAEPHVCVVGSGPAGFYTAQQLLKVYNFLSCTIDVSTIRLSDIWNGVMSDERQEFTLRHDVQHH